MIKLLIVLSSLVLCALGAYIALSTGYKYTGITFLVVTALLTAEVAKIVKNMLKK